MRFSCVLAVALALNGCAGGHLVVPRQAGELARGSAGVSWFGPELARDMSSLVDWRRSVGPPVVASTSSPAEPADRLVVVNWNVHVGGGDIRRLFADVRRQHGNLPVVFLLQEAFRSGPEVPAALDADSAFASAIRAIPRRGAREEIESVASALNLHAYYVPSMRNGAPLVSDEDRGNAILSTLPLDDLCAIELPFERQRRVAVSATIAGTTRGGLPWRMRVVSAHLDNMGGARRLWVAGGEFGRARQARGLLTALGGDMPIVLGADMNTLFGFVDTAYLETARAFPDTRVTDGRPTFAGLLRLDHLFFRLADGWKAQFRRADDNYGSDHYPLIGTITLTGGSLY